MNRKIYNNYYSFEKGFTLSNCLLYYLGWYHRSGDFWADMKKCVEADGFFACSEFDITRLFLGVANEWNMYAANNGYKLIRLDVLIVPEYEVENWAKRIEYHPEWFAMIWKLLGVFAFDYSRTELPIKKPHFSKKSALKHRGYKNGRTYKEANKEVESRFIWAETIEAKKK